MGVVLAAFDGERPIGSVLVPLGRPLDLGAGYVLTPARYILYSGFQYGYDPGSPVVGLGAFVLLTGLCISFYFLPARLFVIARPVGGGTGRRRADRRGCAHQGEGEREANRSRIHVRSLRYRQLHT